MRRHEAIPPSAMREAIISLRSLLIAAMVGWVLGNLPGAWQLISAGLFVVAAFTLGYLEVRHAGRH